jgi:hypothetical protein
MACSQHLGTALENWKWQQRFAFFNWTNPAPIPGKSDTSVQGTWWILPNNIDIFKQMKSL